MEQTLSDEVSSNIEKLEKVVEKEILKFIQ
jgi:hypothetical protein